jgi:hypothetical protein
MPEAARARVDFAPRRPYETNSMNTARLARAKASLELRSSHDHVD